MEQNRPAHAVVVDLRHGEPVTAALKETEHDRTRRFLVIDDAADLVDHQLRYEQLYSYGPARLLCLATGAPGQRQLHRPLPLGPPEAGVLWLPDTLVGAAPGTDRFDASLRPLLELLVEPAVFDSVLGQLADVPHGVAVPAVHVLEHDLTEEARSRAWRQALEHLTGQDLPVSVAPPEGGTASGGTRRDGLTPELSLLLGRSVPRSLADRPWLTPGGRTDIRHEECVDALHDTRDAYEAIRGAAGLFGGAGKEADLPARFEGLAGALAAYRAEVAGALGDGGGDRVRPEQRARLLERGIELTEVPEVTRASVGPALRDHTERLLGQRLPLRSVAATLNALSGRSAPAGSTARLRRLDETCPPERVAELPLPPPFLMRRHWAADVGLALLICCVAGLWPGIGWFSGPLCAAAGAGLAVLMLRRRPSRSRDGRLDGGGDTRALARLAAGAAGGAAGAFAGTALSLPAWAGAAALALALTALVLLAVRDWTAAVDDWWGQTDWAFAAGAVEGVDELLADTVVHDWLLADARYHCSDAARAVAVLVGSLADTVEERLDAGPSVDRGLPADEPGGPSAGQAGGFDWDSWGDGADDDWPEPAVPDAASHTAFPDGGAAHDPYAAGDFGPDTGQSPGPDLGSDLGPGFGPEFRSGYGGDAAPGFGSGFRPGFDDGHATGAAPDPAAGGRSVPHTEGTRAHTDGTRPHAAEEQPHALRSLWPSRSDGDGPPWLERETGDGGPELVDTLVGDLTHGAALILASRWAAVEREPATATRVPLRPLMNELLDEEHRRLIRDAAAAPPPYAPDPGNRPGIAGLLGVSSDRVRRLLADGGTEHVVPLCGAEHRRLLSKDPHAARRFRFAPEALRRGAEPETGQDAWPATAEDVVWTAGGRHAGVLTLVPMRPDTVRSVRGEEGGTR
ncbi:hypothetical protein [Streptomyces kurssanovii]|uniref:Uncharacterized protein n=1 Tax=Streptomyces kurssanovii TaxID=67312 RepID=A0ABV3HS11_9ACTN